MLRARSAGAHGDVAGGPEILGVERARWPGWTPPAALLAAADEAEVRLCLRDGGIPAASTVPARMSALGDEPAVVAVRHLSRGRVLRAERRLDGALASFTSAVDIADAAGPGLTAVDALVQRAVVEETMGEHASARETVVQALARSDRERIVAPFLAAGAAVRPMLLAVETDVDEFATREFRQHLLTLPAGRRRRRAPRTHRASAHRAPAAERRRARSRRSPAVGARPVTPHDPA